MTRCLPQCGWVRALQGSPAGAGPPRVCEHGGHERRRTDPRPHFRHGQKDGGAPDRRGARPGASRCPHGAGRHGGGGRGAGPARTAPRRVVAIRSRSLAPGPRSPGRSAGRSSGQCPRLGGGSGCRPVRLPSTLGRPVLRRAAWAVPGALPPQRRPRWCVGGRRTPGRRPGRLGRQRGRRALRVRHPAGHGHRLHGAPAQTRGARAGPGPRAGGGGRGRRPGGPPPRSVGRAGRRAPGRRPRLDRRDRGNRGSRPPGGGAGGRGQGTGRPQTLGGAPPSSPSTSPPA